jgi:hypothetical protein
MVFSKSDRCYQIEQLKNAQRDKEKEIVLIIEQIDAKECLIDSISLKYQNFVDDLNFDDLNIKEIKGTIKSFQIDLKKAYVSHESIQNWFNKDFVDNNNNSALELKRLKYLLTRYVLEYMNLYKLIEQYEQCLQELLEIENQLYELQK